MNRLSGDVVDQIIKCYRDGMSIRQTAIIVDAAKDTIMVYVQIYRQLREHEGLPPIMCKCGNPAGHKGRCSWAPKKVEKLERLWASGIRTRDIAASLGVSKGAVQVKMKRLRKKAAEVRMEREKVIAIHPRPKAGRKPYVKVDPATRKLRRCLGPLHLDEWFDFLSDSDGDRVCRTCTVANAKRSSALA